VDEPAFRSTALAANASKDEKIAVDVQNAQLVKVNTQLIQGNAQLRKNNAQLVKDNARLVKDNAMLQENRKSEREMAIAEADQLGDEIETLQTSLAGQSAGKKHDLDEMLNYYESLQSESVEHKQTRRAGVKNKKVRRGKREVIQPDCHNEV
jgi:uncharacterized membrane protein YccC